MAHGTHGRVSRNLAKTVETINKAPGLPFSDVLGADQIQQIIDELGVAFRERVFTPFVTLMVFLSQVLSSDHSCRDAVARLIALRLALGQKPCSPDTSGYCEARCRLPEELFQRLVWQTGRQLHEQFPEDWLWKGRQVKLVDGTTVMMPDTPENQEVYPQSKSQKPGLGFPVARVVALLSFRSGAALDLAIGPCRGKETGKNALLRSILDRAVSAGDVVIADRYYSSYCDVALIQARGGDIVVRRHQKRNTDLRQGCRLGKNDYLVTWDKPRQRPKWMDEQTYRNVPDQLILREVKVDVREKGKRVKNLVVVTTLLDPEQYTKDEIAELFKARWNVELDLRSIKTAMQME